MTKQIEIKKAVMLLLLSLAFTTTLLIVLSNNTLKRKLRAEQINSEQILAEKLILNKSLIDLKSSLSNLEGKNIHLDKIVKEIQRNIGSKEAEIARLLNDNASVRQLRIKISELEEIQNKLNGELADLYASNSQLKNDQFALNQLLLEAQNENEHLSSNNSLLEALVADNYRIEAQKGKGDRITTLARKTNKLVVSFDLPEDDVYNQVYFKVLTPSGEELSSINNQSATITYYDNPQNYLVSTDETFLVLNSKRVEMLYKPEQKLEKGIYRFNIYNQSSYLGSIQLRLK